MTRLSRPDPNDATPVTIDGDLGNVSTNRFPFPFHQAHLKQVFANFKPPVKNPESYIFPSLIHNI